MFLQPKIHNGRQEKEFLSKPNVGFPTSGIRLGKVEVRMWKSGEKIRQEVRFLHPGIRLRKETRREVKNQKKGKVRVGLSIFEFCTGGAEGERHNFR